MAVKKNDKNTGRVSIRLPIIPGEAADKYVSVNGRSFLIKRGETVEVPEYVAVVLRESEDQNIYAERMIRKLISNDKE